MKNRSSVLWVKILRWYGRESCFWSGYLCLYG